MIRVSSSTQYITMRDGLQGALGRVAAQQETLASGKRINNLSDAPADAVTSLRYAAEQSDWAAWQRNGEDAQRWLTNADGALQSASSTLQRAQTLANNAVDGGLGQTARNALADEVDSLRAQLVDLANSKIGSRALFAGFQDTAVKQVAGAWTYVGDNGAVQRQIGPAMTIQANLTADKVFGFAAGAGQDVFSALDQLSADIRSGNTAGITAGQTTLAARASDILRGLGTLGALENRVENQLQVGKDTVDELAKQRSSLEDVDYPEAVLRLNQAQTGYQAALGAAAKANLPSLASFLG